MAVVAARRLLQVQARQRRLAVEQRAVRHAVGMHLQQQRLGQRDGLGPWRMQFDEAVGIVREHRRAAEDQRAFAAQGAADLGLRQDARHEALCFRMALAGRQRPGGRQQQARAPVELVGGQLAEPFEHRPLPAALHQRLVQAAFGQRVGGLVLARGERVTGRVVEKAMVGQPLRRARVRARLLPGVQGGEALAQHVARQGVHAQPLARPRRRRRRGCRWRAAPAARRRRRRRPQPGTALGAGGRGSRYADQEIVVPGSRLASSSWTSWPCSSLPSTAMPATSALTSAPRETIGQRQLQAQRPALRQRMQPGRGVAVDAGAETALHELQRFVEAEAQLRRADLRRTGRRRSGHRCRAGSRGGRRSACADWAARCEAGRPAPRAMPPAAARPRR